MKIYIFFAILISGFVLAITAAVKPEIFQQKIAEIKAPIEQARAEELSAEKATRFEQDFAAWALKHPLPAFCDAPKTNLEEVECKNRKDLRRQEFRRLWNS